jgi:hypothetical protein
MFDQNAQNNTQTFAQNDLPATEPVGNLSSVYSDTPMPDGSVVNSLSVPSVTPSIPTPTLTHDDDSSAQNQDLISIKKDALQQLFPLVDHLEQEPEEKFKTMLMMIQASDDKSMLSSAYDVAQKITDEKLKAQALLDIVNEINYFTQKTE